MVIYAIVTLASIILNIVTITIPIFVKKMDIKNQKIVREYEFYQKHRAEAIESYVHYAGAFIKSFDSRAEHDMGFHQFEIYMYIDKSLWHYVDKIQDCLTEPYNLKAAEETLQEFCKKLSENPPRNIKS